MCGVRNKGEGSARLTWERAEGERWMKGLCAVAASAVDAIRLAVFTVSPKIEYLPTPSVNTARALPLTASVANGAIAQPPPALPLSSPEPLQPQHPHRHYFSFPHSPHSIFLLP